MLTFRRLHCHLEEKYGIVVAYSTAAKNFKEMGIRLKIPRPVHPKAASAEEQLAFQREAREEIEDASKAGYPIAFSDDAHAQGYKNVRETAGPGASRPCARRASAARAEYVRSRRVRVGVRHGVP